MTSASIRFVRRAKSSSRRGVTYIMVLGATLLVAAMGLGGLQAVRSQARNANLMRDASSAPNLALSAVAHARLKIKGDQNWRTTYASGNWSTEQLLGSGYFSWKIVDANTGGSVLHAGVNPWSDSASVKLYGKGRVGTVTHTTAVELTATKDPYDAVKSALHAKGNVNLWSGNFWTMTVIGGPLSTDGAFSNDISFTGNVEAQSISNTGTMTGTQTLTTKAKTMPPDSVWDYYRPLATSLSWNTHFAYRWGQYTPNTNILTPTMSNFAVPVTNPDGVYYLSVPGGMGELHFDWVRISGTILLDVQGAGTTIHFGNHILWTPARSDYPMCLIRNAEKVVLDADGNSAPLIEGTNNNGAGTSNYNPIGFPYNGSQNTTKTDTYESRLFGVIHVIGGVGGTPTLTTIFSQHRSTGSIIVSGRVNYQYEYGTILTWDSTYLTNPPLGYYTMKLTPTLGTWKQEVAP